MYFSPFKHRLFWKIMLIFWITTILTIIANIVITKEIAFNEFKVEQLQQKMKTLAIEATTVYEQEGAKALRRWYRKTAKREGIRVSLIHQNGAPVIPPKFRHRHDHDKDDDDFYENEAHRVSPHLLKMADHHISSASGSTYILRLMPSKYLYSRFNPEALHAYRLSASFIIIFLGSLWIARSIAKPIRRLQQASLEIAKGNLDVRVSGDIGKRKDELGQLAHAFDSMADTVSDLLNNQKQLFRDISHEIRTPLTRQKLAIELARDSDISSNLLDKIERQNQAIEDLINQLLTLMQSDNTHPTDANENIVFSELLSDIITAAELDISEKELQIKTNLNNHNDFFGDKVLLTRALENILVNAIKYSPEQSTIELSAQQEGQELVLQIDDEGPGIPELELDDILKPFFRADKSRNRSTGGFGLGLAITDSIIRQHNGTISLFNREGPGLTVKITLPL